VKVYRRGVPEHLRGRGAISENRRLGLQPMDWQKPREGTDVVRIKRGRSWEDVGPGAAPGVDDLVGPLSNGTGAGPVTVRIEAPAPADPEPSAASWPEPAITREAVDKVMASLMAPEPADASEPADPLERAPEPLFDRLATQVRAASAELDKDRLALTQREPVVMAATSSGHFERYLEEHGYELIIRLVQG
jgi:hypothetical protein